jgi:hypothetical protein
VHVCTQALLTSAAEREAALAQQLLAAQEEARRAEAEAAEAAAAAAEAAAAAAEAAAAAAVAAAPPPPPAAEAVEAEGAGMSDGQAKVEVQEGEKVAALEERVRAGGVGGGLIVQVSVQAVAHIRRWTHATHPHAPPSLPPPSPSF